MIMMKVSAIKLRGYHGCKPVEAEKGADFEIDIEAECIEPINPYSDKIEDRPDYEKIAARTVELFNEKRFELIEPLAYKISQRLLAEFELLKNVTIRIRKFAPPMDTKCAYSEISATLER